MSQLAAITKTQAQADPAAADTPQPEQQPDADRKIVVVEPLPAAKRGHLVSTILCQDIANSVANNTPVIYRVLLAVLADRLPVIEQLSVATFWLFDDPGTYRITVRLLLPDESLLLEAGDQAVAETPGTYHMSNFHFGAVAFPLLGRYRAEVFLDEQFAGAYPLFVQPLPGLAAPDQPAPVTTETADQTEEANA